VQRECGVVAVEEALPPVRTLSSVSELQPEHCVAGQAWEWDGVRFTILHPAAADYDRKAAKTNNMSCVLRVENAAGSVLLTSDIEARDEQALLARSPALLASEVLLVPHHGSATSSTPAIAQVSVASAERRRRVLSKIKSMDEMSCPVCARAYIPDSRKGRQ